MKIYKPRVSEKERVVLYDYELGKVVRTEEFAGDYIEVSLGLEYSFLKYKVQKSIDNSWKDLGPYEFILPAEECLPCLDFYYEKKSSDKLIIFFPGMDSIPGYAYLDIRSKLDASVLYFRDKVDVKDDSLGGFLSTKQQNLIPTIIESKITESGVDKKNVVIVGSSVGGAPAIYYASILGVKNMLLGAPSYKPIGLLSNYDYFNQKYGVARTVDDFIERRVLESGGNAQDFNDLISNAFLNSPIQHNIIVSCGIGDWFYENQAKPFYENAISRNDNVSIHLKSYKKHSFNSIVMKKNIAGWVDSFFNGFF